MRVCIEALATFLERLVLKERELLLEAQQV